MSRPSNGPPCPTAERLGELIDRLTEFKETLPGEEDFIQEVCEALDWTANFLMQRKGWQKKQQIKTRIVNRLLKEKMGEELTVVRQQAASEANDEIFEEAANGEPEAEDVDSLSH